jgi:uncharacterized protein (DUF924 family)
MSAAVTTPIASVLIQKTLTFWFKGIRYTSDPIPKECMPLWFFGGKEVDDEIKNAFGDSVRYFLSSKDVPVDFTSSAEGVLTAVIHLDQFTRNVYRGMPEAFSGDLNALSLAKLAVKEQLDVKLHPVYRAFLYLPFEHSENADDQVASVQLFKNLYEEVKDNDLYESLFKGFVKYAEDHKVIIDKFGRYPYRNDVLGRKSTSEETEYLTGGGARFGQ